jgi:thiamine biosynthesis lipoprotein
MILAVSRYSAILLCWFLLGCEQGSPVYEFSGATMGTSYHITAHTEPGNVADQDTLQASVDKRLAQINQQFSTYLTDSDLSIFNSAELGIWHNVPESIVGLSALSLKIHQASEGAFDPTMGPLVEAWGFGAAKREGQLPSMEVLRDLLAQSGMSKLEIDEPGSRLRRNTELQLDFSAIAKGYAVDELALLMADAGYRNFLVEIGGEIRVAGMSPRETHWRLAIERPDGGVGNPFRTVLLSDAAIATSGEYRNFYELNGQRVSHTLDPRTGRPIEHSGVSVTVVAADSARADAWATALNVLGPVEGFELAQRNNIAAFFIYVENDDFASRFTQAFTPYLD